MKKLFYIILLSVFVPCVVSCETQDPEGQVTPEGQEPVEEESPTDIIGLYFAPESISFSTREIRKIVPYIETRSKAERLSLTWESKDPAIATVNQEGLVTAIKPGSTEIVVSATGKEEINGSCRIDVTDYDATARMPELYALLKNRPSYYGLPFYNHSTYMHNVIMLNEVRGDNICLSGHTTDYMYQALRYEDEPASTTGRSRAFWDFSYYILNEVNLPVQVLDTTDVNSRHFAGEALFLRAFLHLNLVNLYALPYNQGPNLTGIPLQLNTYETKEATVGEVYDCVVKDLKAAYSLMHGRDLTEDKDKGYITANAAKALLSRVYLYMEKNAECETLCTELLGLNPSTNLDTDLASYPANTKTSVETIWCIATLPEDNLGMSSIGSWFYSPDGYGHTGWAEMYWSDSLLDLIERYPQDKRLQAYLFQYSALNDGKKVVRWPITEKQNDYKTFMLAFNVDASGDSFSFVAEDGETYTATKEMVNSYPRYYITYNGEKTQVRLCDNFEKSPKYRELQGMRNNFPLLMMTKFSGQDDDPNLCSPAMLRWAEVILNRAEARAKQGKSQAALDDVNIIRERAGLTGDAQMTLSNCLERGYGSVLEVVLDERRMELCFEGHRKTDLFRNRMNADRRYAGHNKWEVIRYDDPRIPYKRPVE